MTAQDRIREYVERSGPNEDYIDTAYSPGGGDVDLTVSDLRDVLRELEASQAPSGQVDIRFTYAEVLHLLSDRPPSQMVGPRFTGWSKIAVEANRIIENDANLCPDCSHTKASHGTPGVLPGCELCDCALAYDTVDT